MKRLQRAFATCLIGLLSLYAVTPACAEHLFSIVDPRGDDHGGGEIVYPSRDDMEAGDLDLLEFSAEAGDGGTWFEARFANPIRSPKDRVGHDYTKLTAYVHEDFYTINVEIYIDTDGEPSSGHTAMLPGRKAEIADEYAWEKAVFVTPRPSVAETLLTKYLVKEEREAYKARHGRVSGDETKTIKAREKERVKDLYYFPNRCKVRNRTLRFFVPETFLGTAPEAHWRYVVAVTGAETEPSVNIDIYNFKRTSPLLMMPVQPGRPRDRFGLTVGADPEQPPIIDLLLPTVELQHRILSDYDVTTGRLVRLVGVTAAGKVDEAEPKATVQTGEDRTQEEAAPTVDPTAPAPEIRTSEDADTMQESQETTPRSAAQEGNRTIEERLKELNKLLDEGLITKEEHEELRRKVLWDL